MRCRRYCQNIVMNINLNPKLFARVKAVYDKKDELGLDKEQMKLLEEDL